MESDDGSSSSMRRVPLNGRQPVSKTGVARKAKGSIPSPSSNLRVAAAETVDRAGL